MAFAQQSFGRAHRDEDRFGAGVQNIFCCAQKIPLARRFEFIRRSDSQ